MSSVQLTNITKKFKDVTAVKDLNLTINEGEFFTFLGPSGCGKTTTLRMIAGFYYPTAGTITFNDRDMTKVPPEKRNTGMVFQNYALFPHMSVFENVAFGLKVRKLNKSDIKRKVMDVLEKVRLEQYYDRQVSQLSGGQQQRVALARALVIEPDILLLDEPLSNLDARLRDQMRTEILRLQRDFGITTIYVTHDQVEALTMSDRIAVFNMGKCQQVGTPLDIYNNPVNDFVAQFIGETNLFPVEPEITDEQIKVYKLKDSNFKIHAKHKKSEISDDKHSGLYMSIRPEAVRLKNEKMEGNNVVEGVIEIVQFTGASVHFFVRVDKSITVRITRLNKGPHTYFNEGDKVFVQLPEEHIRIVPKAGE